MHGTQTPEAGLAGDVLKALTTGDTLRGTLQQCCEAMVGRLDAAFARIWTLETGSSVLELQASAGMYTHIDGPHSRVPVGALKIGLVASEREPHLTNEVRTDPRVGDREWAVREGMVAFAGYPLIVEDRLVGVMAMFARRPLGEVTLRALAAVADSIALGIDRKRAEERLREETRIIETLYRIGNAVAAELDVDRVVQMVTDAATELSGAQFGAFFYNVYDEDGGSYMLYTLSGAPKEAFSSFPMPRNTDIFALTFAGDDIVRLDDVTADPRYGNNPPYHGMPEGHLPVRSYLAVPVTARSGEVVGGLFFGHSEPGVFTEREERVVAGIASHAAVAIDNGRLYDAERRAREAAELARQRLELLADASRALASSLDPDQTLANLLEVLVPRIADRCVIYLTRESQTPRRVAFLDREHGSWEDVSFGYEPSLDNPADPIGAAVVTGAEFLIPEVDHDLIASLVPPEHLEAAKAAAGSSVLVLPLTGRAGTFGALTLVTTVSGRRYSESDLPLAREVAGRAAVAYENATLFAQQRGVAEILQRSLLPERLPETPAIDAAARYMPGGPGTEVGGDWYDVFILPGGSLGVVMGDVVGRGVPAASLMGRLRNALRAYALEGHSPAEVVKRLDRLLQFIDPDHLATLVYAVYDPGTGTLRLTNAGHPPPLVVDPHRSATFLEEGRSVPLGALAHTEYLEAVTVLSPGCALVLYTDGLVEERGASLEEGFARLRDAVINGPDDLEELCDHVLAEGIGGADAHDDVALLVLRPTLVGERLSFTLPARSDTLASLRAILRRWMGQADIRDEDAYDVLVSCGEACTNAIEHAYGPGDGSFDVEAWIDGGVHVVVRDAGRWREPRPSIRGRGLSIMQGLMDEVRIDSNENGTQVHMFKQLRTTNAERGS